MNLILKMQKGNDFITIKCKDKKHYDKLIRRFTNNGYKQI